MIGKIVHGGSFGGIIDYVNDPKKHAVLIAHSDNQNVTSNQAMIDSFELQASMNPHVGKPACHIILGFSKHDAHRLSPKLLESIVCDYLHRMGYDDTQFVAFQHVHQNQPHCHVIANRINNRGKTISDKNERLRNVKMCKELTGKYSLYIAYGKEAVNEKALRNMDALKYHVRHYCMESLASASTWQQFADDLEKMGIRLNFCYDKKDHDLRGLSFTLDHTRYEGGNLRHDISFSGKKLDQELCFSAVCKQLGNPQMLVREMARDQYDEAREEFRFHSTLDEWLRRDEIFPDFDEAFPELTKRFSSLVTSFDNDNDDSLSEQFIAGSEDAAKVVNEMVFCNMDALGIMLFQPYEAHISMGGGDSGSSKGWGENDKDKFNNKRRNVRHKGISR